MNNPDDKDLEDLFGDLKDSTNQEYPHDKFTGTRLEYIFNIRRMNRNKGLGCLILAIFICIIFGTIFTLIDPEIFKLLF